jgi:hypothetical protein
MVPRSLLRSRLAAALAGLVAALAPVAAFADDGSTRDRVMIWTTVVVLLTLFLCGVGYAYRRLRGMDHPTTDEIEMMSSAEHPHGEHAAAGHH